ncbi:hypothetical protein L9F63_005891 [Diploptera punctata]|uniref:Uncharacterized protein n=1 Tax=Diploptera punctata TaxID=6984 RepID=A0AAD7ZBK1_DIPPU|nr:hypothetical protein L9F63_005891 [Diploptera punctata]
MMSAPVFVLVLLSTVLVCNARAANKPQDKKDMMSADHDMYQHMIFPDPKTLPAKYFGPDYVWDTKGFPRKVEEVEKPKDNKKKLK